MTPLTNSIREVARELEFLSPRLSIRLQTIATEAQKIERLMNEIIEDAAEDERAQAEREAAIHAAVVRDLAIDQSPNVARIGRAFGMPFLAHAVGDRS